jgi:hypothetical protein
VLDLDLTLIYGHIHNYANTNLTDLAKLKDQDYNTKLFHLTELTDVYMIERPGLRDFLTDLNLFANVYIYTNAIPEYTAKVLEFIDPKNQYFKNIISREKASNGNVSKDLRKFNLSENEIKNTLILDDNIKAWTIDHASYIIPCSKFCPIWTETNRSSLQEFSLYYSFPGENGVVTIDCSKCKVYEKYTPKHSHLEITLLQLKSLYIEYCIHNKEPFHDVYINRLKNILNGTKFFINMSVDCKLANSIIKIIKTLGGVICDSITGGSVVLGYKSKKEYDIYYPVYCYLMLCKLPVDRYLVQ